MMQSMQSIQEHEGRKYLTPVSGWDEADLPRTIYVDVYAVLVGFDVRCPARQHAIKKLLCAGKRGKGDERADIAGALAAVSRAVELVGISTP